MKTCLDSPRADPKFKCCFGVTQTLPIEGQHGLALTERQFQDRIADPLSHRCRLGLVIGSRSAIDYIAREWARSDLTYRTPGDVEGDSGVPRTKSFWGSQAWQSDQGGDGRLLKDVCDHGAVSEQPQGH